MVPLYKGWNIIPSSFVNYFNNPFEPTSHRENGRIIGWYPCCLTPSKEPFKYHIRHIRGWLFRGPHPKGLPPFSLWTNISWFMSLGRLLWLRHWQLSPVAMISGSGTGGGGLDVLTFNKNTGGKGCPKLTCWLQHMQDASWNASLRDSWTPPVSFNWDYFFRALFQGGGGWHCRGYSPLH